MVHCSELIAGTINTAEGACILFAFVLEGDGDVGHRLSLAGNLLVNIFAAKFSFLLLYLSTNSRLK
jgi:hypothetical protein